MSAAGGGCVEIYVGDTISIPGIVVLDEGIYSRLSTDSIDHQHGQHAVRQSDGLLGSSEQRTRIDKPAPRGHIPEILP